MNKRSCFQNRVSSDVLRVPLTRNGCKATDKQVNAEPFTQCTIHTPYRSQYAAIALTTPCTSFMQILLTKCVIFSQALSLAP